MEIPIQPDAIAVIKGSEAAPRLRGTVKFYQRCGSVLIVVCVCGLPENSNGFFALHVHEGGDCSGEAFSDTGSHYNPDSLSHSNHPGDLPPILSCKGRAYLAVQTDRFCLREILGRTIVIHGGSDDFRSQPAGNPGMKIACGVICRA